MIMVAIGVDRYLSICQPMLGALTSRRAWIVSSVLGLFAAMIGLCVALMYKCQLSFTNIRQRAADNILRRAVCTEIKLRFALMYSVRHYKLVALQSNCTSTTVPDNEVDVLTTSAASVLVQVDHGVCYPTHEVFSLDFIWYFQKVYNGLFLACFISVVVLYVLIYRSVLRRRSRHQRQKHRSMSLIATSSHRQRASSAARRTTGSIMSVVDEPRTAELHVIATGNERSVMTSSAGAAAAMSTSGDDAMLQSARDRKRNRVANVKTAAMLFVVTVVFVVTFLPASPQHTGCQEPLPEITQILCLSEI